MLCWVNGQYVERTKVCCVAKEGRDFLEVLRTYDGVPVFLAAHVTRLTERMQRVGLVMPYTVSELNHVIETLMEDALWEDQCVHLRVAENGELSVFRSALIPVATPKVACWGERVLEQSLLVAGDDVMQNDLFWAKNGALFTIVQTKEQSPPVARVQLIQLAKIIGLRVIEGHFKKCDVEQADEIFVASAVEELVPIEQLGQKCFPAKDGPIFRKLLFAYRHHIACIIKGELQ